MSLQQQLRRLPWKSKTHYQHVPVQTLQSPFPLQRHLLKNEEATSLFKDYVEALYENSLNEIETILEPKFYKRALASVEDAHQQDAKWTLEWFKRGHETEFYLYNLEYVLFSGNIDGLDRTQYGTDDITVERNEEVHVNGKPLTATLISHQPSFEYQATVQTKLLMRAYFAVHTYTNLYQEGQGYPITNRSSRAHKHTHFMTLDKPVASVPSIQTLLGKDAKQTLKQFGRRDNILISDVDEFMPEGNPLTL